MERFLLSQVLAKASKLESMCDKDLHILKEGAKEIPQDLLRKGERFLRESSLKGICKRSKCCFFPSLLSGKGIQSLPRASKHRVQENLRVWGERGSLARRGDTLACQQTGISLHR